MTKMTLKTYNTPNESHKLLKPRLWPHGWPTLNIFAPNLFLTLFLLGLGRRLQGGFLSFCWYYRPYVASTMILHLFIWETEYLCGADSSLGTSMSNIQAEKRGLITLDQSGHFLFLEYSVHFSMFYMHPCLFQGHKAFLMLYLSCCSLFLFPGGPESIIAVNNANAWCTQINFTLPIICLNNVLGIIFLVL